MRRKIDVTTKNKTRVFLTFKIHTKTLGKEIVFTSNKPKHISKTRPWSTNTSCASQPILKVYLSRCDPISKFYICKWAQNILNSRYEPASLCNLTVFKDDGSIAVFNIQSSLLFQKKVAFIHLIFPVIIWVTCARTTLRIARTIYHTCIIVFVYFSNTLQEKNLFKTLKICYSQSAYRWYASKV